MTVYIVSIVLLLMLSAFFSATETAFTSMNRIKMKNLASDDVKNAVLVLKLTERYDKLLSGILIGNNIVNISVTSVTTVLCIKIWGSIGATIATVIITLLVLIFGEITPKSLAKDKADEFSLAVAPVVNVVMHIFAPLTFIFSAWKRFIDFLFKSNSSKGITQDELITMVDEAHKEGSIGEAESKLIINAIEFEELEAIDVVTPRVDIVAFELGEDVEEIGKVFKETGFSRIPVYEDDLDNIIGVLNQKDFHNYVITKISTIEEYIKPVAYVAESIKAADLLKRMQAKKTHIAIIVDEYGGTTGLVTMEDIIEELVGKIYDEHDAVEIKEVKKLYDGSYSVAGNANVEKFFEIFGEEIDLDATTINGWAMIALDKLPKAGDVFTYNSKHKTFECRVTKADSKKALRIHIKVTNRPEED